MNALVPSDTGSAMALANMMATGKLVPSHLQRSPGDCLMVIEQAMRWGMSPFAVAQCTSVISGKLMFEGKLVSAALNSSGILAKRLDYDFAGEGDTRTITVVGTLRGEDKPRDIEVKLKDARTNNGAWQKQPDQQLVYFATRAWARRHAPEVMLGVYSPEEFDEPVKAPFAGTTIDAAPEPPLRQAATPRANGWAPLSPDGGVPIDPLDEENGTKWLKNLDAILAQAASVSEITDIEAHPSVTKARANAPSLVKERIADMVQKARGRFTVEDAAVENAPEHEPVSEAAAFRARVETMSLQQLQRLDTNAQHKAWLRGLTPPDYADAADAIAGRLQALRGGSG